VSVQIPLDGPDQNLSLVGSGRVVAKFHCTDPTRPDPRTAWVSAHIRGLCLVVDWSAQSLVGSGRAWFGPVRIRVVEFGSS